MAKCAKSGQVVYLFGAESLVRPVMGVQRSLGRGGIAEPAAEASRAKRLEPDGAYAPGVARDVLSILHVAPFFEVQNVPDKNPACKSLVTFCHLHGHCLEDGARNFG